MLLCFTLDVCAFFFFVFLFIFFQFIHVLRFYSWFILPCCFVLGWMCMGWVKKKRQDQWKRQHKQTRWWRMRTGYLPSLAEALNIGAERLCTAWLNSGEAMVEVWCNSPGHHTMGRTWLHWRGSAGCFLGWSICLRWEMNWLGLFSLERRRVKGALIESYRELWWDLKV